MDAEERVRRYIHNLMISTMVGSVGSVLLVMLLVILIVPSFFLGQSSIFDDNSEYLKYIDVYHEIKDEYNVGVDVTYLMALERIYPDFYSTNGIYSIDVINELSKQMIEEKNESYTLEYTDSFFNFEEVITNKKLDNSIEITEEELSYFVESNGIKKEMSGTKLIVIETTYEMINKSEKAICNETNDCKRVTEYTLKKEITTEESYVENWVVTFYKYDESKFISYIRELYSMSDDDVTMIKEMSAINKELIGFTNKGLVPWFMYPSPIDKLPLDSMTRNSAFGFRLDPFTNDVKFHNGVDYASGVGDDIYATAPGVVAEVGFHNLAGKYYVIEHEYKGYVYYSKSAHCSDVLVKVGDKVASEQIIAKTGNTGKSTGSHLHIEYYYFDGDEKIHIDPELLFTDLK